VLIILCESLTALNEMKLSVKRKVIVVLNNYELIESVTMHDEILALEGNQT